MKRAYLMAVLISDSRCFLRLMFGCQDLVSLLPGSLIVFVRCFFVIVCWPF